MNDELAKYMLREIRSIGRYDIILKSIEEDMQRISSEIEAVLSPTCPNGKAGPKIEHPSVAKQTIVNSLLSDEMELMERQKKFEHLKNEASFLRTRFLAACKGSEMTFGIAVADGVPYAKIEKNIGYSNAFDHAMRICKTLKY